MPFRNNDATYAAKWGMHFTVGSNFYDIFSASTTLNWSFSSSLDQYYPNKVVSFSYLSQGGTLSEVRNYLLVAPADNNAVILNPTSITGVSLTASPFTVPWMWGKNYLLNQQMSYAWSNPEGNLEIYAYDTNTLWATGMPSDSVPCVISAMTDSFSTSARIQKVAFQIKLGSKLVLDSTATQFKIR